MTDERTPDPQDLAGEYVLGTLPIAARREVEAALLHDPALGAAVAEWEARLLPLAQLVAPQEPSPSLWPRIAGSIAPQLAPRRAGWWNSLALWRGLAATGLAAALVLAAVPMRTLRAPSPRYMVVLAAPDSLAPGWVLQSQESDSLRLVPLRATNVPAGRALQLWTKADGWSGPVSLGLVQAGKPVEVPLGKLPPLQPNQLFEITLEPPAGSPLTRPTGPILFIGRAVKLS